MQVMNDTKDPGATLDYIFDWSAWLAGDTILRHVVTAGAGINIDSTVDNGKEVIVWLSGGKEEQLYHIKCRVVTNGGRIDERTMVIRVRQR